jgi:uncharacterized surface anchored protein
MLGAPSDSRFKDDNFYVCIINNYVDENNLTQSPQRLTDVQLRSIQNLDCSNKEIDDVTGLNLLTGLKSLDLSNNHIMHIDLSLLNDDVGTQNYDEENPIGDENPIVDNNCKIANKINICNQTRTVDKTTVNNEAIVDLKDYGITNDNFNRITVITENVQLNNKGQLVFSPTITSIKYNYNSMYNLQLEGRKLLLPVTLSINGSTAPIDDRPEDNIGRITIQKTDADLKDAFLDGAEFEICKNNDENRCQKCITGSGNNTKGHCEINNLVLGTYTIKEIKAPEGYMKVDDEQEITLTSSEPELLIVFRNKQIQSEADPNKEVGTIVINKVDNKGNPLEKVKFSLYASDNNGKFSRAKAVRTLLTDANGKITFENVAVGSYVIKEVEVPTGYSTNNTEYYVEVTKGKITELKVVNYEKETKVGTIKIIKIDREGKPLEGAKFTLSNKDNLIKNITSISNEEGIILFDSLPFGEYTVKEINAPEGYKLDSTEFTFTISDDKLNHEKKIVNIKINGDNIPDDADNALDGDEAPDTGIKYYIMIPIILLVLFAVGYKYLLGKNKFTLGKR